MSDAASIVPLLRGAVRLAFAAALLVVGATAAAPPETAGLVEVGPAPFDPFDADFRARVQDLAIHASDLRIRILYSSEMVMEPNGLVVTKDLIDRDTLADQARGATDPLVLALLVARCARSGAVPSRCDPVDVARRWTVADTQNQMAWVALARALHDAGDVAGARDAFERAARASAWRDPYLSLAQVVADWLARAPLGLRRRDADLMALSKAGAGLSVSTYQSLSSACSGAPERRAVCGTIIETMARDAETSLGLGMAARLAERSSLPDATVRAIRQEYDAVQWGMALVRPSPGPDGEPLGSDDAYLDALATIGERRYAHRMLAREGVDDATAARRYAASLSDAQRAAQRGGPRFESTPRERSW